MTIVAATTPYGQPAVELLARQISELKAGDPLAPVTVVVPSNYVAVAARRALAARPGGVVNVTFLTLHRLAERLGAPALAAAGRLPVSAPVLTTAVRAALADAPGVFGPVADHPATEKALVAAHRELATVTAGALDAVAACSPRAADVVRIHRDVRARLAHDWHDESDLLVAATEAIRTEPAVVVELGPIVVHLLHDLTAAGGEFVQGLARATTELRVNVALTGDADADRPVIAAHARAGIRVRDDHGIEPGCAAAIVSASDPDDEVRAAIRRVAEWMHDGVNLGRVALLYGMNDPYARLLHEQLTAAGIPFNGAPVRAVGDLLFGRTLRSLLSLPDRGYRRADVLAVLSGAPVLDDGEHVHSRAWEKISREAGVVDGGDWDARLAVYAGQQRHRAERADEDENGRQAEYLRNDATRADSLAAFVHRLRDDLDRGHSSTTWAALVDWTKQLVTSYLGDEGRRATWPDDERRAAERVEEAIDRLAGLDNVDGPPPTVEVFRRSLEGELDLALRRVGRLGDGVLVGPVSTASGLVFDRVVVLGMAEGAYPPRRLEDSLLPDAERAAANGELPLRAHRVHDDRRHLLAAVAAAGHTVFCQPRGDLRRSGERPASRWLLRDAAELACTPGLRSGDLAGYAGEPWLDHIPSFTVGLARAPIPATEQDLRLAAVARGAPGHALLTGDEALTSGLDVVRQRRSAAFTRFDGNLTALAGEIGEPPQTSATRLQAWASCPHAYLLQHVLGVEPVDEPERRLEMSALDKGSLVHEILDTFVKDAIEAGEPADCWTPADRARLHLVAEGLFARYESEGLAGRALFWRRDQGRIRADLDRFLDDDNGRFAEGLRPVATERWFESLAVNLPSGRVLHVRGSVDRIDRGGDGTLVVLDYKTGRADDYRRLTEDDPHLNGTRLQLYLYAEAARELIPTDKAVRAEYWFNTTKGAYTRIGYTVTDRVAAAVGGAIDTIVDGIAGGVFPARPPEQAAWGYVDCVYCRPDGLSATERRREWERKRLDPALAAYVALAEPEALDDDA